MKHLFATLALVAAVALIAGSLSFRAASEPEVQNAIARQDAMAWLRMDFQLTDAQYAAIKQLHDSYSVVCEEHCRAILRATRARKELQSSAAPDPAALAAAEQRVQELRLTCESAIAAHVRQCAAEMSPDAGRRYLALVLPKIKDFDHAAAPDLQLNHAHH